MNNQAISAKEEYRSIYKKFDLPIHFTPEWMDAVCIRGSWDVILEKDAKNRLVGILVYHTRKKYGMTLILMPMLTAYNGIFIFYPPGTKGHSKISYQNRVTESLISQLPKCSLYYQQYHTEYTNWLNLYWQGYNQTTRYTYILDKRQGEDLLREKLKGTLRRSFRHVKNNFTIVQQDFNSFWDALEKSFRNRQKEIPYNKQALSNLFSTFGSDQLSAKSCIHNETGELVSGAVVVADKTTSYFIANYYTPTARPSGSLGYLMWRSVFDFETIKCDFEGSMLKEIEFFLRSFGGQLTPHYKIHKIHNPVLRLGLKIFKPQLFA